MKKITLFAGLALSLMLSTSCNRGNASAENNAITVTEQTRGGHEASENAPTTTQSAKKVMLARKWVNGDKFMDIQLEGTFTANLGNGEIAGKWELNEDSGALTFAGQAVADGKGSGDKAVYTLKEISDSQLKIVDNAGTEQLFNAQ